MTETNVNVYYGTESRSIAGFWTRIGAFAIDTIILGTAGIALGFVFEERFVQLGGWGPVVGFVIALFYFGVMNSRLFNGQTVGKKLVNIRVVDSQNCPIGVSRSFARYSVLGIPFFLNGAQFANEVLTSFWMYLVSLIAFGGLLSATYLYVFNRVSRQSLHDLAVGSYVVNAESEKVEVGSFWRPHLIVVAALLLASALVDFFTSRFVQNERFKDLLPARAAIAEHPSVTYAAISDLTSTQISINDKAAPTRYLSVRAFLRNDNVSDSELARQLATILADSYSGSHQVDVIQIVLTYGYNIGIASSWSNYSHTYDPSELAGEN